MSITITLSHKLETLEALRDEWIDLQSRTSAAGMALTWQWIHIWFKHFHHMGELWLLTARHDHRLVGIAPLIKVKEQPDRFFAWQQIEFIGAPLYLEHLDFIIEPGYEEQVIPLFIDKLHQHRAQWDVIYLAGMSETKTPDILQQSDPNWLENTRNNKVSPYMTLPDTIDDWMQSLSSKRRWSLRRDRAKLDEQFPDRWTITRIQQPDKLDNAFDHLVRLHQTYWEGKGDWGSFHLGQLTEYYRELAYCLLENGWLRMYSLNIDDVPCAIDLCYHYRGRAYGQLTGVNRDITNVALGIVLKEHIIGEAINEGLREFSFMEGKMPYKYSFGGIDRVHQAFQLIGSPRVQLQVKTVDVLRQVKSRLRQLKSTTNGKASAPLANNGDEK